MGGQAAGVVGKPTYNPERIPFIEQRVVGVSAIARQLQIGRSSVFRSPKGVRFSYRL